MTLQDESPCTRQQRPIPSRSPFGGVDSEVYTEIEGGMPLEFVTTPKCDAIFDC